MTNSFLATGKKTSVRASNHIGSSPFEKKSEYVQVLLRKNGFDNMQRFE